MVLFANVFDPNPEESVHRSNISFSENDVTQRMTETMIHTKYHFHD